MNVQQDDQNRTKRRKDPPLPAIDLPKMRTPIGSFAGSQDFLSRFADSNPTFRASSDRCYRASLILSKFVRLSRAAIHADTSPSKVNVRISCPSFRSQRRSVWSAEPETTWRPSGVTTTAVTQLVWPSSVVLVCPVTRSQTR